MNKISSFLLRTYKSIFKGENLVSLFKKVIVVALLSFALGIALPYVSDLHFYDVAEASSLKDSVKSNSTTTLTKTVDTAGTNVVKLGRDLGIVGLVIMLVWMGYSLFVKKSVEGLAEMKGRLGAALVAIAFIFFSEQILGAIFGIFGYTIS